MMAEPREFLLRSQAADPRERVHVARGTYPSELRARRFRLFDDALMLAKKRKRESVGTRATLRVAALHVPDMRNLDYRPPTHSITFIQKRPQA